MSGSAAIVLDRVTKVYDSPVVADVSLEAAAGSFMTLLGPSGSGKSTILHMIGGFIAPTSGHVLLAGHDVTALPPNKRPCNTIFQDLGLFPHMTVAQNVAYGLKLRGLPAAARNARVADMLALVALEAFAQRRIHQLSGGQRQRVALARALILEPSVLLLDEPLTGLDERLRQQLRDEIGRLHRRLGATFLAVTHNQDEAFSLSDQVALLRAGQVEQIGAPRDLFERPANAFVARFIGYDALLIPDAVEHGATGWVAVLAGRRIVCDPPDRQVMGAGYRVALRPERIGIATPGATGDLGPAAVLSIAFKGRDTEVELRLPDGQVLKVLVPADRWSTLPTPGTEVELILPPRTALLVAETAAGPL